ncbi:Excinuclease ABC subunit A [Thermogutta terrifontis]|uniref:UvrABC system protein A n=1 Tax=Thermogutta terrifontis TaxID=1331910 RepID=A0A286RGD2_9BACT|nr:excinuclease ABC subunit UvrA [Thermogutta terrifontis]ASV75006.1 Excinuclease ABC subunit A [Thermogutta terrifontis]
MSSPRRSIIIRGARTHNLKSVDVEIPKGKLTVLCGPSGSGKTSLAFDTLYVEGQRRYIESLSARIRQHFEDLPRPDVDFIGNLSPTVAVGNQTQTRGIRGDVAQLTEIFDFLRLLYTHLGEIFCPDCGWPVRSWDSQAIAETLQADWLKGRRAIVAFNVAEGFSTASDPVDRLKETAAKLAADGWTRVLLGNRIFAVEDVPALITEAGLSNREASLGGQAAVENGHDQLLAVIVDRIQLGSCPESRLRESVETALAQGTGKCLVFVEKRDSASCTGRPGEFCSERGTLVGEVVWKSCRLDDREWLRAEFARQFVCPTCGQVFARPEPNLFNSRTAIGACPRCQGTGKVATLDPAKVFPDFHLSLEKGAIAPLRRAGLSRFQEELLRQAKEFGIPVDQPVCDLTPEQLGLVLYGSEERGVAGLEGILRKLERQRHQFAWRAWMQQWKIEIRCPQCRGTQLSREALSVFLESRWQKVERPGEKNELRIPAANHEDGGGLVQRLNIRQFCSLTVDEAIEFVHHLVSRRPETRQAVYCREAILQRLLSLRELGLGHINLDRAGNSLSSGELRRTLLAAALGSGLKQVVYILDEPSAGLHPRDRSALRRMIHHLRDRGNTVVVIEHDEALIREADLVIELGPGAGERGGEVVFQGSPKDLANASTLTAEYINHRRQIAFTRPRRQAQGWIRLAGASGHNLKDITVEFPLGVLCAVTGVSGAGKSTLVEKTLYPALVQKLRGVGPQPLPFSDLLGEKQIGDVVLVDQTIPGKTWRSNPATFIKAFDEIRKVFAQSSDARVRGYGVSHFSFNSREGQCPRCEGEGFLEIDMVFLPNMEISCPECEGTRYRQEILAISYRGKNIADILHMTVREAYFFFRGEPQIQGKLRRLMDVGLDYVRLGQPMASLSSGESQRLKLASYFSRSRKKPTLFILNEPTRGLHPHDIHQLMECFDTLISLGHSLLVIEHNLALVASADYVIDLGPGAGLEGGRVVAHGTPEEIAACPDSVTGQFLLKILEGRSSPESRSRTQRVE